MSLARDVESWLDDTSGHPLGSLSTGRTLRQDGESHREAWMRTIRADPCSYCGAPGGTVDHVDHRRGRRVLHGLHGWPNYTAACERCNEAKSEEKLLLWLVRRPLVAHLGGAMPGPRETTALDGRGPSDDVVDPDRLDDLGRPDREVADWTDEAAEMAA